MTFCKCNTPIPYLPSHPNTIALREGWCKVCYYPINRKNLIEKCDFGCNPKLSWGKRIKHEKEVWRTCQIDCTYKTCGNTIGVMINTTNQHASDDINQELIIISLWNEKIRKKQQNPYENLDGNPF